MLDFHRHLAEPLSRPVGKLLTATVSNSHEGPQTIERRGGISLLFAGESFERIPDHVGLALPALLCEPLEGGFQLADRRATGGPGRPGTCLARQPIGPISTKITSCASSEKLRDLQPEEPLG